MCVCVSIISEVGYEKLDMKSAFTELYDPRSKNYSFMCVSIYIFRQKLE